MPRVPAVDDVLVNVTELPVAPVTSTAMLPAVTDVSSTARPVAPLPT